MIELFDDIDIKTTFDDLIIKSIVPTNIEEFSDVLKMYDINIIVEFGSGKNRNCVMRIVKNQTLLTLHKDFFKDLTYESFKENIEWLKSNINSNNRDNIKVLPFNEVSKAIKEKAIKNRLSPYKREILFYILDNVVVSNRVKGQYIRITYKSGKLHFTSPEHYNINTIILDELYNMLTSDRYINFVTKYKK